MRKYMKTFDLNCFTNSEKQSGKNRCSKARVKKILWDTKIWNEVLFFEDVVL